MNDEEAKAAKIPRDRDNDYTNTNAARRRDFVSERTGSSLSHVSNYSFEPSVLPGNIENFMGVAQVPMGVAGPLVIHGEHARGNAAGGGLLQRAGLLFGALEFLCSNGDNRRDIGCQL